MRFCGGQEATVAPPQNRKRGFNARNHEIWRVTLPFPTQLTLGGPEAHVSTPLISFVVPALNEEGHLPDLLASASLAAENFKQGSESVEIVVADNESSDSTALIAREYGCVVATIRASSIAAVRNAGAAVASGEILAFVDADSRVHPQVLNAIHRTLSPRVIVGATGITMSRSSAGIALTMLVVGVTAHLLRVGPGVVFCRRKDWAEIGGFDESRLYAEDVKFQSDLKRLGRQRGQKFAWAKNVRTVSSARKFDKHGDWHAFGLLWHWVRGPAAFRSFVKDYWYDPNR